MCAALLKFNISKDPEEDPEVDKAIGYYLFLPPLLYN